MVSSWFVVVSVVLTQLIIDQVSRSLNILLPCNHTATFDLALPRITTPRRQTVQLLLLLRLNGKLPALQWVTILGPISTRKMPRHCH
jgi:hypothetical protein